MTVANTDPANEGPRARKVKILATVGPTSRSPEMLEKLYRAGVDAFRVNMSHGDHATHAETIAAIRALEIKVNHPITILADLQGPKLRVGVFKGDRAVIRHSGHFTLDRNPEPGDETRVCLPHPELFGILKKGQRLLIDDGKLRLRVIRADPDAILCTAEVGGVISNRKGVNVPDAVVPVPALTDKDRRDLAFALEQQADWIALSFVQRPEDLAEARKLINGRAALMAKIEKPAAIGRLDEIIELSDGIMVARGDLGVELNPEEVPPLQKRIVTMSRQQGKPVVDALIAELPQTSDAALRNSMLSGLSDVLDPALTNEVRDFALSKPVKVGEMASLLRGGRDTLAQRDALWAWFTDRYPKILARTGSFAGGGLPRMAAGGGCSTAEVTRVQAFFAPRVKDAAGVDRGLAQTSEAIQLCSALKAKQDPASIVR